MNTSGLLQNEHEALDFTYFARDLKYSWLGELSKNGNSFFHEVA